MTRKNNAQNNPADFVPDSRDNHPSGDPTPSQADVEMTIEIRDAADKLGIALYDHIIVARGGTTSLKAQGLM
jgi:DNA repair protein RadC